MFDRRKYFSLVFLLVFFYSFLYAQPSKIDSLLISLKNAKPDTGKANLFNELSVEYRNKNSYDTALEQAEEALKLSRELNYKNGIATAFKNYAIVYYQKGNYRAMLDYFQKALLIRKELGNKKQISGVYSNMGVAYWAMGDYINAQKSYLESLKISEQLKDKGGIATTELNMGILSWSQGKYKEAISYYERALKAHQQIGDKKGVANAYANMANSYHSLEDFKNALEYNVKALQVREEMLDSNEIANSYINIANVLTNMKLFEKADEYSKRALFIKQKLGDKGSEGLILLNMGNRYLKQNNITNALIFMNNALILAKESEDLELIKNTYDALHDAYTQAGKYNLALENYKEYIKVKDSLINEKNIQKITEDKMNYEFDKKQREEQLIQQQKDELTKAEAKRQAIVRNFLIAGCFLMLLIAVLIFRSFRQTRKANKIIAAQKQEVEVQKAMVDQKNKDIMDSINYAQRIQDAIFPEKEIKYRLFPDAFVYFRPRDVVSGDFYWFAEKNGKRFIAAVDCTGHGVPGAFMSIIGNHLLNEIVIEKGILQPAEILNALHKGVRSVLKQEEQKKQSPDGMDIALCCFEGVDKVEFAGAQRPLYLVSGETLSEIKPDKLSIGGTDFREDKNFTNHSLTLKKGDAVYISSDGYADQFGGEKGKKLMSKNFKEILLANFDLPMHEQEKSLNKIIEKWMGGREQIDDILVIGVRI